MLNSRVFATLLAIAGAPVPVTFAQEQRVDSSINGNFRDGQPMVMTPAPAPADRSIATSARFRSAYTRAKSPRVVIFWNREFSDEVTSEYQDYASIDGHSSSRGSSSAEAYRTRRTASAEASAESESDTSVEIRSGTRRMDNAARSSDLTEAVDFDVQQAFQSSLAQSGVRLIDRSSIMRTTGASKKVAGMANVQEVEADAILAKTDIVVEIVRMTDDRARDGAVFRIIARDVRNARILASFRSSGVPPVGHQPYVAGPNGFERARPRKPTPSDLGRQLALETMRNLTGTL